MHTISIHVRCIRMNHNIATSQQRRIASGIAVAFNLISFAVRFRFAQRLPCTPNKSLHLCVIEHINMVNRLWCAAVQIAYNEMKNHSTYRIGHRHHLVCHRLCLSWRAGASHMIVQSCSRGFFAVDASTTIAFFFGSLLLSFSSLFIFIRLISLNVVGTCFDMLTIACPFAVHSTYLLE